MFKTLITLARGRAHDAEEQLVDRNALAILDQQMRDASASVARAKKALAIAMAQDAQEEQRLAATRRQTVDLEARAVAALQGGREDLAEQAAQSIAGLEADAAAAQKARDYFTVEIAKLRRHVGKMGARLAELERGRRVARAAQAVRHARRGRVEEAPCHQSTLTEAEATLARLRQQQSEAAAADCALDGIDASEDAETLTEKMSRAGFGPATEPRASDILARLKAKATGTNP
jgi:phage shock protein A